MRKTFTLTAALFVMGCGSSEFNGNFPNNPIPLAAPTAVPDFFSTPGNSQLSASVTANDTLNGATVSQFQNPSTSGGTVAITGNGALTYTPPNGAANLSDTFTYTVSNQAGTSTATVTVQVGPLGLFVKNDAPGGGNGSQASPFNTLAAAQAAAVGVPAAEIIIFRGDGSSTGQAGPVTLLANQTLRAQDPANPPLLTGPITLATNTTLSDLRLNGSGGVIANGIGGFTMRNCTVSNTTGDGLALTNLTGNVTLSGNQLLQNGGRGLALQANSGLLGMALSNNTISLSTTEGIFANVTGTSNVTWTETGTRILDAGTNPFGNSWNLFSRNTGAFNATMTGCLSDGASRFGLEMQSFDASNTTLVFDQGIVRNGADRGIALGALGNSTFKARVSNTQTHQNLPGFGFEAGNGDFALMCLRLVGVNSDVYRLGNNNPTAPFNIENFVNFGTENTGTVDVLGGTINNVAIGSCGIP